MFIIASIVIIVAATTRENGVVMAFSSISPSHIAALPRRLSSAPPLHVASSPSSASSSPQQLDAILFDCDGVLADTERDGHRISFNMAFASFGINEVWDEVRYGRLLAVGGGKERMTAHFNEVGWPPQIPIDQRSETIKQLHVKKTEIFMQLINDGSIPLRKGILRLVDEAIRHNVQLAVCSTSSAEAVTNLVQTLMGTERSNKFKIYAGDMVQHKKPSPDIYLMAVHDMALQKENCIIIEDSHIGLHAAMAAGINCLVTKSSYTFNEDFTGAKCVVNELEDTITLSTLSGLIPLLDQKNDDNDDESMTTTSSLLSIVVPTATSAATTTTTTWDRVGHVETAGASWTGARFGDDNINRPNLYTPSETYEATRRANIGVHMVSHVEKGGASWTGARFGDDNINRPPSSYTPSATYKARRGNIGVKMVSHVEKGGASWTGARLGEETSNDGVSDKAYAYTPSETYEYKSKSKGPGSRWDTIAHVERNDDDNFAWTGARFAIDDDENDSKNSGRYRQSAPTPSRWRE